jgi:putative restriction endonuclease
MPGFSDQAVRMAAFDWLVEQTSIHGEVIPWAVLLGGFRFRGDRVALVSQQGIFTPRVCRLPLSILTSPGGPYADALPGDGRLLYRYRGTDPAHRDNARLRQAMLEGVPLVYFFGHAKGRYHAIWPVFVVGDDPGSLTFTVAVDDAAYLPESFHSAVMDEIVEPRRAYITATVRRRLHQQGFRERVLHAYREQCALCKLRHRELLDAAHIVADREPEGEPRVSNGLALCKLHHAAFDSYFLTVGPEYRVIVRRDLLEEEDGPTLRHALQGLHGERIQLPRRADLRPSEALLARRLIEFETRAR